MNNLLNKRTEKFKILAVPVTKITGTIIFCDCSGAVEVKPNDADPDPQHWLGVMFIFGPILFPLFDTVSEYRK
jgi:hypothetical protein